MDFREWLQLWERNYVDGQPFLDSLDALIYIRDKHPDPRNLVVTFTEVDKVGINPRSLHDTPLGIYFYTIDYVIGRKQAVEYAGGQPFMHVCELTRPDKVLRMQKNGSEEGIDLLYRAFDKEKVDLALKTFNLKYMESNYQKLWKVSGYLCSQGSPSPSRMEKIVKWNRAFRDMGISGFVDEGTGTIFITEPSQGVVFQSSDLRVIHTLENTKKKFRGMPFYDKKGRYWTLEGKYSDAQAFYRNFFRAKTDLQRRQLVDMQDLSDLMASTETLANKRHLADIILKHKGTWYAKDVIAMLSPRVTDATGLKAMATALGKDKIMMLDSDDLDYLIKNAKDEKEMVAVLQPALFGNRHSST